jgi:tetratricopeptide (TPR) repeat protein
VRAALEGVPRPTGKVRFPGGRAQGADSAAEPKPRFPGMPLNNLPFRNPHFTGREEQLQAISDAFQSDGLASKIQRITGLGGIGKTQLAIHYAYTHAEDYEDVIWFVNAETPASIIAGYRDFLAKNGLLDQNADADEIVDKTKEWLSSHQSWLFIYDNADKKDDLRPYLPYLPNRPSDTNDIKGHILITARNAHQRIGESIGFSVFTDGDASLFLSKRLQSKKSQRISALAKRLGYLPLALEQAAAYMMNASISVDEYAELLDECSLGVFQDEEMSKPDFYNALITTTWEISFQKIKSEGARQLFNLCAYMAPDNIPLDFVEAVSNQLPDKLPDALRIGLGDPLEKNRWMKELTEYSLVRREGGELFIHRLVQEVVREQLKDEPQWLDMCFELMLYVHSFDFSTAELRTQFLRRASHAEAAIGYAKAQYQEDFSRQQDIANLYAWLGRGYSEMAWYAQALSAYQEALKIREKVLGKEHPNTATVYNNIALVYRDQGDYGKALEWHEKALAIHEKALGKEHPDTADSYNYIAVVYGEQGDYAKALEWHEKALAIREKALGKEHLDTASSYHNIAGIYNYQGEYEKALEQYEKALAIAEKILHAEHPDIATTYNNIALVYKNQGDYGKALEQYKKSMAIAEKILGKEHPNIAVVYNNIAGVYNYQGEYEKALEWHEKALTIHEKALGAKHPHTATGYSNIALVYRNQGNYDKALEGYGKALAIVEEVLGKEHPQTAITYSNIANVYNYQGDYAKALKFYEKALTIEEKALGEEHPDIATAYNNIAMVYYHQEEYKKALEWHEKALPICEKALGKDHPNTASSYNNTAMACYHQEEYEKALELFFKSYRVRFHKLGEKHPSTITAKENMEITYRECGLAESFEAWLQGKIDR